MQRSFIWNTVYKTEEAYTEVILAPVKQQLLYWALN